MKRCRDCFQAEEFAQPVVVDPCSLELISNRAVVGMENGGVGFVRDGITAPERTIPPLDVLAEHDIGTRNPFPHRPANRRADIIER